MKNFIDTLNNYIKDYRKENSININSFLVTKNEIKSHRTFHVIKEYSITLYIINESPIELYKSTIDFSSSKEESKIAQQKTESEIMKFIFKNFNKIILGNYEII